MFRNLKKQKKQQQQQTKISNTKKVLNVSNKTKKSSGSNFAILKIKAQKNVIVTRFVQNQKQQKEYYYT